MTLPYRIVSDELESAQTAAALVEASNNIQYVASITERERLGAIVKRRLEQFKSK